MAEKINKIEEILNELFTGQDGALGKYSKVRHTQYELSLWQEHALPLWLVSGKAKNYFSKRFLGGKKIPSGKNLPNEATKEELDKGLSDLDNAVKYGCPKRCFRLVKELNEELAVYKIQPVDSEKFLDWLTFAYSVRKDCFGEPILEPGFAFEIRDFYDDRNRKDFWRETKALLKEGEILSMHDILEIVMKKRNKAVKIK